MVGRHGLRKMEKGAEFLPNCSGQRTCKNKMSQGLRLARTVGTKKLFWGKVENTGTQRKEIKEEFVVGLLVPQSESTEVMTTPDVGW